MPQDHNSGAAGDEFGTATAPKIAIALGAKMTRKGSNEATLDGKRVVIKCAAPRTGSVGVTFKMLDHLDAVVGAFQNEDGNFVVFLLSAVVFRENMTETRSRGQSAGKVGIVSKRVFATKGEMLGNYRVDVA